MIYYIIYPCELLYYISP
eukprot:UN03736